MATDDKKTRVGLIEAGRVFYRGIDTILKNADMPEETQKTFAAVKVEIGRVLGDLTANQVEDAIADGQRLLQQQPKPHKRLGGLC